MTGPLHHNWKGGATSEAKLGRNSTAYITWRRTVYERDHFTCQDCQQLGRRLVAHHLIPWAADEELRFDPSNGVTVCIDCHKQRHPDQPQLKGKSIEPRHTMKHTEETKARISAAKKGQIPPNKGQRGVQVPWNKGLTKTDAPILSNAGKVNAERLRGKIGPASPAWKRWHPDD